MNDKAKTGGQPVDGIPAPSLAPEIVEGLEVLAPYAFEALKRTIEFFLPFVTNLIRGNKKSYEDEGRIKEYQEKLLRNGIDFEPFENVSDNPLSDEGYDALIILAPHKNLASWSFEQLGRFAVQAPNPCPTLQALVGYQQFCRRAWQVDFLGDPKGIGVEREFGPKPGVVWHCQIPERHHTFYWDMNQIYVIPCFEGLRQQDLDVDLGFNTIPLGGLYDAFKKIRRHIKGKTVDERWTHLYPRVITSGVEGAFNTKWRKPGDLLNRTYESHIIKGVTELISKAWWDEERYITEKQDITFYHSRLGKYAHSSTTRNVEYYGEGKDGVLQFKRDKPVPFSVSKYGFTPYLKRSNQGEEKSPGGGPRLQTLKSSMLDDRYLLEKQVVGRDQAAESDKPAVVAGWPGRSVIPYAARRDGVWYTCPLYPVEAGGYRHVSDCDVAVILTPIDRDERYIDSLSATQNAGVPKWVGESYWALQGLFHNGGREAPMYREETDLFNPMREGFVWNALGEVGLTYRITPQPGEMDTFADGTTIPAGRRVYLATYQTMSCQVSWPVPQREGFHTKGADLHSLSHAIREVCGRILFEYGMPARQAMAVHNPYRIRINLLMGTAPEECNRQFGATAETGLAKFLQTEFYTSGINLQMGYSLVIYDKNCHEGYTPTDEPDYILREYLFSTDNTIVEEVAGNPPCPVMPLGRDGREIRWGPQYPPNRALDEDPSDKDAFFAHGWEEEVKRIERKKKWTSDDPVLFRNPPEDEAPAAGEPPGTPPAAHPDMPPASPAGRMRVYTSGPLPGGLRPYLPAMLEVDPKLLEWRTVQEERRLMLLRWKQKLRDTTNKVCFLEKRHDEEKKKWKEELENVKEDAKKTRTEEKRKAASVSRELEKARADLEKAELEWTRAKQSMEMGFKVEMATREKEWRKQEAKNREDFQKMQSRKLDEEWERQRAEARKELEWYKERMDGEEKRKLELEWECRC